MTLVVVEVPDEAAVEELRRNPNLRIVRIVEEVPAAPLTPGKPRSWAGLLPKQTGEQMLQELAEIRSEWERNS